jgi:hypothetical protein
MLSEAQFLFRAIVAPIPLSFLQLTKQVAADSRLAALKQKNPKHKFACTHWNNLIKKIPNISLLALIETTLSKKSQT